MVSDFLARKKEKKTELFKNLCRILISKAAEVTLAFLRKL